MGIILRFNSLQTGKSFRTYHYSILSFLMIVSIPFKRESPFGHERVSFAGPEEVKRFHSLQTGKSFRTYNLGSGDPVHLCFHSLQTGKSFRTDAIFRVEDPRGELVSIPFKRESPFGLPYAWRYKMRSFCFNSLQTGKSFRTRTEPFEKNQASCFNSLRTGKSFRTMTKAVVKTKTVKVSIPFKRESPFGRL